MSFGRGGGGGGERSCRTWAPFGDEGLTSSNGWGGGGGGGGGREGGREDTTSFLPAANCSGSVILSKQTRLQPIYIGCNFSHVQVGLDVVGPLRFGL
jgi:hypothetical protein